MEPGTEITVKIIDMTEDGKGIGKADGLAIFVEPGNRAKSVVPGDTVTARVRKAKKNYAFAELTKIVEASPDRIEAACPFFGECGGCTMQELSYEAQLRLKRGQVISKLERIGGVGSPVVNDMIGAERLTYYRNKATFAVGPHGEVGFLKGKSHFVIDIDDCMLQCDAAMVAAEALRTFLAGRRGTGITQMTVRTSFSTGEVMVVLESEKRDVPDVEKLVEMLDDAVYSVSFSLESVAVTTNGKTRIIAGKPTITDEAELADGKKIRFEISPQSFYQVNPEQMPVLYGKAAEYAVLKGGETVLDLYCGAGTIGLWLLGELRSRDEEAFGRTRVFGIESVKSAVIDANRNSVINGIVNTRYVCGKAEEELPKLTGAGAESAAGSEMAEPLKADVAVLDPPRAGCEPALLDAVAEAGPDRIVYVSCDPGTLARDMKYLSDKGYRFVECTPIDQFPWTGHCEAVALITRTGI